LTFSARPKCPRELPFHIAQRSFANKRETAEGFFLAGIRNSTNGKDHNAPLLSRSQYRYSLLLVKLFPSGIGGVKIEEIECL
jgi:hypothetical protein